MTSHPDPPPPLARRQPGEAYQAARLRWAALTDAERLTKLYAAARPEQPESIADMSDWLEHGGALLLENRTGDLLSALRWREAGEGWLVDRIATLPDERGQGFGRWLMTKVEALAIRSNIPSLTLQLKGHELLGYYRRLGYRIVKEEGEHLTLCKQVGGVWQYKETRA
ncbi:MAG: GNAT family N-acetyltransferase [Trueperaceae bacterium]|nr:MAG: GNAT family N-acetyltransferase [Trueperaceae bacterium]